MFIHSTIITVINKRRTTIVNVFRQIIKITTKPRTIHCDLDFTQFTTSTIRKKLLFYLHLK